MFYILAYHWCEHMYTILLLFCIVLHLSRVFPFNPCLRNYVGGTSFFTVARFTRKGADPQERCVCVARTASLSQRFLHDLDCLPVICCNGMPVCSLVLATLEIEKYVEAYRTVKPDMHTCR